MEENASTTSEKRKTNYFILLQEIDKLINLSTNSHNSPNMIGETLNISEIETILNNVAEDIESVLDKMAVHKKTMFIISIFNTILRISAIDGFDGIISRKPFQSIFKKVNDLIYDIIYTYGVSAPCAYDILDSMLMNLAKDDFIEICFKRLLSNKTVSTEDIVTTNKEYSQDDTMDFNKIMGKYMDDVTIFSCMSVIRSVNEFKNNYKPLMISIQTFLDHCLTNTDKRIPSTLLVVLTSILTLIWDLTDKLGLIPMLIDIDYVKKSIEWIRSDVFVSHMSSLGKPIICIAYNLSRVKAALKQFHTEKAFETLMERKQLVDNENDEMLTRIFGTAIISLATSDEQPEENKKFILDTSQNLYKLCNKGDQVPDFKTDGYHISELLQLLHRAFSNIYVIKYILENKTDENRSPIQYFEELFLSSYGVLLDPEPDDLEKQAVKFLLKILLQISSYPEYLNEFINNNQFCIIIESLANRPQLDDAKRIWCNIQQILSPDESKKETSSMIYISYDWADDEFCKEFVKELRNRIIMPIWVDYEKVELCDDMWEYSSPIIKSATVIIALVSTAYGESSDKFQELSYIISTNKSRDEKKGLIVVKAEPNFNFNRYWMTDLLSGKIVIPYENNIGNMASHVCNQIIVSKKPLIKCLSCQVKAARKKAVEFDDSSANSDIKILKSVSSADSSRDPIKTYVRQESTNIVNGSSAPISTRKYGSHSIVVDLITETGSSDFSTWV